MGGSHAAHLRQAQKTAEALGLPFEGVEGMDPGDPPSGFSFIWEVYIDLHLSRQSGMGPCAIAYTDILAWCRLNRVQLHTWEVDVIRQIDLVYLGVMNDDMKKKSKEKDPDNTTRRPGAGSS